MRKGVKDSTEISRRYFTSSNQTAGKKRKRTRAKSISKKTKSSRLKKKNLKKSTTLRYHNILI